MFIDEWFADGFYRMLGVEHRRSFAVGQIYRTHTYYPHENLEFWRPVPEPDEPTKTIATKFQITAAGKDAFRKGIPLAFPRLETNEEFIVVRAKVRPVALIVPQGAPFGVDSAGYRGKVQRNLCLVAQIFGLADVTTKRQEFSSNFIDRVRTMEFPELMFLPARPGFLEVDSILRLDELQSVFTPNLNPTQLALSDEMSEILKGQLQYLVARSGPTGYTELRELLLRS